jgi:hypothetical protein
VTRILFGSVIGAVAGFLTRPCCVVPTAMSLAGVSGAALAQQAATYRPALMSASMVILAVTLWTTFRREGGLFNKVLAASATMIGFVLSLRLLGVF